MLKRFPLKNLIKNTRKKKQNSKQKFITTFKGGKLSAVKVNICNVCKVLNITLLQMLIRFPMKKLIKNNIKQKTN